MPVRARWQAGACAGGGGKVPAIGKDARSGQRFPTPARSASRVPDRYPVSCEAGSQPPGVGQDPTMPPPHPGNWHNAWRVKLSRKERKDRNPLGVCQTRPAPHRPFFVASSGSHRARPVPARSVPADGSAPRIDPVVIGAIAGAGTSAPLDMGDSALQSTATGAGRRRSDCGFPHDWRGISPTPPPNRPASAPVFPAGQRPPSKACPLLRVRASLPKPTR